MNRPPIEFDKQDPGHGSFGPLEWAKLYVPTKDKLMTGKKLSPREPIVHASHGNCYGRGYNAILRMSMVSPWPSSLNRNNELLQYRSRSARGIRGGDAKTE